MHNWKKNVQESHYDNEHNRFKIEKFVWVNSIKNGIIEKYTDNYLFWKVLTEIEQIFDLNEY